MHLVLSIFILNIFVVSIYCDLAAKDAVAGDRYEEELQNANGDELVNKLLYIYRQSEGIPPISSEYQKRSNSNKFKNLMLTKDILVAEIPEVQPIEPVRNFYIPRALHKRTPGTVWTLPLANNIRFSGTRNLHPVGLSRPPQ